MKARTSGVWIATFAVTAAAAVVLTALLSWDLEPEHPVSKLAAAIDEINVEEPPAEPSPKARATPIVKWTNPLVGTWRLKGIKTDSKDNPLVPIPESAAHTTFTFSEATLTLNQTSAGRPISRMERPYSYKRGQDGEVIIRMTDMQDKAVGDETTLRLVGDELVWLGQPPFALVFEREG